MPEDSQFLPFDQSVIELGGELEVELEDVDEERGEKSDGEDADAIGEVDGDDEVEESDKTEEGKNVVYEAAKENTVAEKPVDPEITETEEEEVESVDGHKVSATAADS